MFIKIALRNIFRNPRSSFLIVLFTAFICMLFMLASSLSMTIQKGLQRTFRSNITGDFVVMSRSDTEMSLFGANVPAIGEFFEIPSLNGHDLLLEIINAIDGTEDTTSQVSGTALMDIHGRRYPLPFFGVDLKGHFDFFPAVRLLEGSLPLAGERAVLLSAAMAAKIARESEKAIVPGEMIKLNTLGPDGFRIRALRIAGIYSYSGSGPVLDSVVLTDMQTARELNSVLVSEYVSGIGDDEIGRLDGDYDSLFEESENSDTQELKPEGSVLSLLDGFNSEDSPEQEEMENGTDSQSTKGSWQFIIVKIKSGTDKARYRHDLEKALAGFDVEILDWNKAAGSSASFAWVLQLLFVIAMIIIIVTGSTGITNLMFTAYSSRIREIGTIRAIGGQKTSVVRLFVYEYSLLVLTGGLIGLAAAALVTTIINALGMQVSNTIMQMMLGSGTFAFSLSFGSAITALSVTVLIGIFSSFIPLARAVSVRPVFAMEGGAY
ncbi:MAG: FtsX-like permease family protein [Spirochaetales bacterium]|nr:FtsX-like permease family protein [Spirochaetales bacterium]